MIMNSKLYDFLKRAGVYYLPALATFVIAFGEIWNIPMTTQVGATITALIPFINAFVKASKSKFLEYEEEHQENCEPYVIEEEGEADA